MAERVSVTYIYILPISLTYGWQVHSLHQIQADDAEQFVSVGAVATETVGLTRWLVVLQFLEFRRPSCVYAACYFHHPCATRIPAWLISLSLETGSVRRFVIAILLRD